MWPSREHSSPVFPVLCLFSRLSYCSLFCLRFTVGEISSHNSEMQDIERNIRSMQNDMTKLNTLITKESGLREALQQGTVLMESDFIQALKVSDQLSTTLFYLCFFHSRRWIRALGKVCKWLTLRIWEIILLKKQG